jgi:hypothetical protein
MKKASIFTGLVIAGFLVPAAGHAAEHCVRPAAGGGEEGCPIDGDGTRWDCASSDGGPGAYAGLPETFVRGDTYHVAGGSYPGRTLGTEASGTSMITIKGATIADHGTDTGWSDAYSVETSQAHFTSSFSIMTSSWTLDGAVGSMSPAASTYGFQLDPSSCSGPQVAIQFGNWTTGPLSDYVIQHVAFLACGGDIEKEAITPHSQSDNLSDITVSNCLFDGWQGAITSGNDTGTSNNNYTIEYNYFVHHFSSSSHHGEWINNNASTDNWVIRFNRFMDATGTACIAANNADILSAFVYGNVFVSCSSGNGIISGTSAGRLSNAMVYNNTFVSCGGGPWINGGQLGGSGNVAYDNLLYDMNAELGSGSSSDYNAYFGTTNTPDETHRQSGTGDPFVDSGSGNYRLAAATEAGTALPSPYDVDVDGATRGADGVWDRGAYEYNAPQPCADLGGICCEPGLDCRGGRFAVSTDCGPQCCLEGDCAPPPEEFPETVEEEGPAEADDVMDAVQDGIPDVSTDATSDDAGPADTGPGEAGDEGGGGCGCAVAR